MNYIQKNPEVSNPINKTEKMVAIILLQKNMQDLKYS